MKARNAYQSGQGIALSDALVLLATASIQQLRQQWQEAFRHPPPRGVRRDMLCRALAFELQAAALGNVPARTARRLRAENGPAPARASSPTLRSGTRLARDWQGTTHHVLVLDSGFEYQGTRFESLSALARHITGTRWSGPRFFGLTDHGRGDD